MFYKYLKIRRMRGRYLSLGLLFAYFSGVHPGGVPLFAQAPLTSDQVYLTDTGATLESIWKLEAAVESLRSGLSSVAVRLFGHLRASGEWEIASRPELAWDYVAALIAQGDFDSADLVLKEIPERADPSRRALYAACLLYGQDSNPDLSEIKAELSVVVEESLDGLDLPWYYLMRGILADREGETTEAERYFKMAETVAPSPALSTLFSSLILRQRVLTSPTDADLLPEIREKFEALSGQSTAFPFLREYAILLHGVGRGLESVAILDQEMEDSSAVYSIEERADLLLLKGLILGVESDPGWAALQDLLRSEIATEAALIALRIMGSVPDRQKDLMILLNEIISRPVAHPLLPQLYFLRCQLALSDPETAALAEADARYLLEQYPGLAEISSVYRLLVYAALQRDPPRYREAADYLLELREQSSEPDQLATLNRLIGDSYFLNRDYANAVDFYEAAYLMLEPDASGSKVFLRLVISKLKSGDTARALEIVDQADARGGVEDSDRWQAEWSIALALQASGRMEEALIRLRRLIARDADGVPSSLDLRLRWLEARMSLLLGKSTDLSDKLDRLLGRIETMPEMAADAMEYSRLKSELLLLKSKDFITSGSADAAFAVCASIRSDFPASSAAQRTYFVEAEYHADVGDYASAQRILESLSLAYPDSVLAPQSLFEAALYCQRRGAEHYGEAAVLLDRVVKKYEGSELAYQAGLKQGDLLRLMNDFPGAQRIYENLINSYPSHPLRYVAELSLADASAALSQGAKEQFSEAIPILERLVDRSDLPVEVQIEAGYKWGSLLERNQNSDAALTVFSLITGRYLLDSRSTSELTAAGHYWLSRTIFALGELLEVKREPREALKLYRKLVAYNLPGRRLAQSKIDQLDLAQGE